MRGRLAALREEVLPDSALRHENAIKVLRLRLSENVSERESFSFGFAQDDGG